jgi:hypothetical protein
MAIGVLVVFAAFGSHFGSPTTAVHADVTDVDIVDLSVIETDDDAECDVDNSGIDTVNYSLLNINPFDLIRVPVLSVVPICIDVDSDAEGLSVDTNEAGLSIGGCWDAATDPGWDPENCIGTLNQGTTRFTSKVTRTTAPTT